MQISLGRIIWSNKQSRREKQFNGIAVRFKRIAYCGPEKLSQIAFAAAGSALSAAIRPAAEAEFVVKVEQAENDSFVEGNPVNLISNAGL